MRKSTPGSMLIPWPMEAARSPEHAIIAGIYGFARLYPVHIYCLVYIHLMINAGIYIWLAYSARNNCLCYKFRKPHARLKCIK